MTLNVDFEENKPDQNERAAVRARSGRRPDRAPRHERGGLRQSDEAREPRPSGERRHRASRTPRPPRSQRTPTGSSRSPAVPTDRSTAPCARASTALAEARLVRLKAAFGDRLYVEIQRHGLRAEHEVEPQLLQLAYAHELPDRRHQRGLLREPRRLRGARCAAVHRGGPLRRRGQPPPRHARARLQERRGDGGGVRRSARGARATPSRSPSAAPSAPRAASRSCRASSPATIRSARPSSRGWRPPSCGARPS